MISQTVAPLLVQAHQVDPLRYKIKRQQYMDVMVWSSIFLAIGISSVASPVIRLLYGEIYSDAIPVLQILAWRAVLMALFTASGQMIIIESLQRYAVMRNVIGCIVSILLNYLLIPVWGIIGSAVATVVTMVFSGYLSHFIILPYRYLVPIQTRALFLGWRQGLWVLRKYDKR